MRLTKPEREFMGDTLRFLRGFGCTNVRLKAVDGMLNSHAEYRGRYVDWQIPRIDFHYPRAPRRRGAADQALKMFRAMGVYPKGKKEEVLV